VFFVICVVMPYIQGAIARRRPKREPLGSPGPLPPDAQNQSA
jgi:hypothetical protein